MSGAESEPWRVHPMALRSRRPGARVSHADALRLLESEREVVTSLVIRALVEAWDTGRISRPGEGDALRERELLGMMGVRQGLAGARIDEVERQVADVVAAAAALDRSIVGLRPLRELADDFDLTALALKVLVLVAAPQLWGELAQVYAILSSPVAREVVDEHLLRLLLGPGSDPHDLARELLPSAPLRRSGLVHTVGAAARPFTGLVPDPIVLSRLRGEPLDEDPSGMLDVRAPGLPVEVLRIPAEVSRALRAALERAPSRPLRLVVRGREGSGRRTLLSSLSGLAGRRLAVVNLHQLGDPSRSVVSELRGALARCALAGWIPCVDGVDAVRSDDRTLRERVRQVLSEFPGPLGLRLDPESHPPLDPGYVQVDLHDLTETERLSVWRSELSSAGVSSADAVLGSLTSRWRIGPGTIHRVVEQVTSGGGEVTGASIDAAVAQHLERSLGDVAERIHRLPRLSDLVLPADIMDSMTEFLSRLRMHRQVFEDWGMTRVMTTSHGITALFQGPPGTGKTMIAGALARELGLDLYRVDLSRVMSKWIGETERNLGNVFTAAEQSQALLLFDEADSLFGKRTEVKSSNDRFANLEVNYLLQRLDSFTGVAILTTNLGTAIDPAFKRRLSFRVHFPIPDEEQREQLWRSHLPASLPTSDDLDLGDLARRYPLTGGSVRNCVLRAAFLAAAEQATLSQSHLVRAVRLEYRAAGKLSESGPLE